MLVSANDITTGCKTMAEKPRRGRRDNTDPESTHREILQAALEVLAKDGPESLSVSEVARRAGVNRGTAYQHFPLSIRLHELKPHTELLLGKRSRSSQRD